MRHDAIVIGAGRDGVGGAAYRGRVARRVLVLERRKIVGGPASPRSGGPASIARQRDTAERAPRNRIVGIHA